MLFLFLSFFSLSFILLFSRFISPTSFFPISLSLYRTHPNSISLSLPHSLILPLPLQEATAIGAIWLDVFSSDPLERTDGAGLTRLSDSFSFISNKDMARQTLQVSSVASYLHDDPAMFKNDRLADDV